MARSTPRRVLGEGQRLLEIDRRGQRQHRAELFAEQQIVLPRCRHHGDEDAGRRADPDTRAFGDPDGAFADGGKVQAALAEKVFAQPVGVGLIADMGARAAQRAFHVAAIAVQRQDDAFIGAKDGIIEALALYQTARGGIDPGRRIDIGDRIARPDAKRRIARGIGRPHHGGAAGCDDDVDPVRGHDVLHQRDRRLLDTLDQARRRACRLGRLGQMTRGGGGDGFRDGVGADDDGIATQNRQHRLVIDRRNRVRRRRQRKDHARRFRQFDDLAFRVDARGDQIEIAVVIKQRVAAKLVLDLLVFDDAKAGLGHGEVGEMTRLLIPRPRDRLGNGQHRVAAEAAVVSRRPGRTADLHPGTGERAVRHRQAGRIECHVFAHAARLPDLRSCLARGMAESKRSRISWQRSTSRTTPGLNCNTRLSSDEKIAQTPFS